MKSFLLMILIVMMTHLTAAEKANKPALVNSNGCECNVEGPDEICQIRTTVEVTIRLINGKDNTVKCTVELKGTSDARWGDEKGDKKFTTNLKCDGSTFKTATLWSGTKPDTEIEIWVNKTKCKTIKVVKCPTETITAGAGQCSGGEYGGSFTYTYSCAQGWYVREKITPPDVAQCGGRVPLTRSEDPQPLDNNAIIDHIKNRGNPATLARSCVEVNEQTIFLGPTPDECRNNPCTYKHTHTLKVTLTPDSSPRTGTVEASVNNQKTTCSF